MCYFLLQFVLNYGGFVYSFDNELFTISQRVLSESMLVLLLSFDQFKEWRFFANCIRRLILPLCSGDGRATIVDVSDRLISQSTLPLVQYRHVESTETTYLPLHKCLKNWIDWAEFQKEKNYRKENGKFLQRKRQYRTVLCKVVFMEIEKTSDLSLPETIYAAQFVRKSVA